MALFHFQMPSLLSAIHIVWRPISLIPPLSGTPHIVTLSHSKSNITVNCYVIDFACFPSTILSRIGLVVETPQVIFTQVNPTQHVPWCVILKASINNVKIITMWLTAPFVHYPAFGPLALDETVLEWPPCLLSHHHSLQKMLEERRKELKLIVDVLRSNSCQRFRRVVACAVCTIDGGTSTIRNPLSPHNQKAPVASKRMAGAVKGAIKITLPVNFLWRRRISLVRG